MHFSLSDGAGGLFKAGCQWIGLLTRRIRRGAAQMREHQRGCRAQARAVAERPASAIIEIERVVASLRHSDFPCELASRSPAVSAVDRQDLGMAESEDGD